MDSQGLGQSHPCRLCLLPPWPLSGKFLNDFILFLIIYICGGRVCVHVSVMPLKSRRGCQIPYCWNYRQLWAMLHGSGNPTLVSGRAVNALSHWAISPPLRQVSYGVQTSQDRCYASLTLLGSLSGFSCNVSSLPTLYALPYQGLLAGPATLQYTAWPPKLSLEISLEASMAL